MWSGLLHLWFIAQTCCFTECPGFPRVSWLGSLTTHPREADLSAQQLLRFISYFFPSQQEDGSFEQAALLLSSPAVLLLPRHSS